MTAIDSLTPQASFAASPNNAVHAHATWSDRRGGTTIDQTCHAMGRGERAGEGTAAAQQQGKRQAGCAGDAMQCNAMQCNAIRCMFVCLFVGHVRRGLGGAYLERVLLAVVEVDLFREAALQLPLHAPNKQ